MGLDPNLPTLDIQPRPGAGGTAVDLIEHKTGEYQYAAYKEDDKLHLCGSSVNWLDPESEAHLATVTTFPPEKNGKHTLKAVELISPPGVVELKNTGGMSWEWTFLWEEHLYSWRRDTVSLLGSERGYTLFVKPSDKNYQDTWPVVIYSPSKKGCTVQTLHYNLDRLDPPLQDKKGQEILAFVTLLSFLDTLFMPPVNPHAVPLDPRTQAHIRGSSYPPVADPLVPPISPVDDKGKGKEPAPPLPARRPEPIYIDPLNPNEILILDETRRDDYRQKALALLPDKSLLFISLIASQPAMSGTTMQLAEEIKRSWYREHGEELKTFIPPPDAPAPPPPPPPPSSMFSRKRPYIPPPPPPSLKIFIAREDLGLPNYMPKAPVAPKPKGKDWRPPIVFNSTPTPTPSPLISSAGHGKAQEDAKLKKNATTGKGSGFRIGGWG